MGWKQHAVRRYTDGYIPSNSKCPFSPLPSMQYPPLPWLIILCVSSYVDVDVSKVHYRMERTNMVTDVYHYGCKKFLGFKFVLVPVETKVVETGRFLLYLEKLRRWDGNNLVYGHTIELVENA
ncbi:uncharacterized protein LOC114301865 [Camellia sinensis]|uniref:uncharacterized protein LOC114301865 n=1 Tax=Camellia sinensis TaxID=4442 RepID=UPI0010361295|nr:uncharacterized protein LOC114301865 [Camellia sinensis]